MKPIEIKSSRHNGGFDIIDDYGQVKLVIEPADKKQIKQQDNWEEEISKILSLENDPDGDIQCLLIRDINDEIVNSISFSEEVRELNALIQKERAEAYQEGLSSKKGKIFRAGINIGKERKEPNLHAYKRVKEQAKEELKTELREWAITKDWYNSLTINQLLDKLK